MGQKKESVIVRIAGAAGDGIASAGELFGKICSRQGLHVMAYNAYQSAIRGGHVWLQLNVGSNKTLTHGEKPDVAVLLNRTSPAVHIPDMKEGGVVFYNSSLITEDLSKMRDDLTYYHFPFRELVNEPGVTAVMANIMLVGCVIQVLGLDSKFGMEFIEDRFQKKGKEVVDLNKRILQLGIDWAKEHAKPLDVSLKGDGKRRMFLTGNHSLGMGLLAHGLKLYAAYPMSPSTGVLHYLATKAKSHKIVVKQTEDELSSINYIIGAGHAGVRAATATSGGGFALMTEALGLSGMLEVPIVVINVQRGGPSTGIPTKHEQGDLNMILGASQGEFARIIIAPKDVTEAFHAAGRALNLAEKYQTPVVILSDLFLSEHFQTADPFHVEQPINRGKVQREVTPDYKRFRLTDDGVSPRLIPGAPNGMYCAPSDEHDEEGIVTSDVLAGLPESRDLREKLQTKRMKKLETMRAEDMLPPVLYGPKDADVTLVGWGASYDAIQEAVQIFNKDGLKVNHLHFTDMYPLPNEKVLEMLKSCKDLVAVEANFTGQLVKLLRAETGFHIKRFVRRFDGEPFTGEDIYHRAKKELGLCLK